MLLEKGGAPLCFNAYAPAYTIDKPHDYLAYHFITGLELEVCHLEFVVARGSAWPSWADLPYFAGNTGIFEYGQGPTPINLGANYRHFMVKHP